MTFYIRIQSSFINKTVLIDNQWNDLNWLSTEIILISIKNNSLDQQSTKQSYQHQKQQQFISSTLTTISEASQSTIDLIWQLMNNESATFWWTPNERNSQQLIIIWVIALNTSELQESVTTHETAKHLTQQEDTKTTRQNTEQHNRSLYINTYLISHDSIFSIEIIRF